MLVLGPDLERLTAPIPAKRFSVSIDNGPWFRATHVREEGDDPISLAITARCAWTRHGLIPPIAKTLSNIGSLSLGREDHISIYGLDCSLVHLLDDVPADSATLQVETQRAFDSWKKRGQNLGEGDCKNPAYLWDSLMYVTGQLYKTQGRRVVLAVSDGRDVRGVPTDPQGMPAGSTHSWNELTNYAQWTSVAIFGVSYVPEFGSDLHQISVRNGKDPFHEVCESSGGLCLRRRLDPLHEEWRRL